MMDNNHFSTEQAMPYPTILVHVDDSAATADRIRIAADDQAPAAADPALGQLVRLWPTLHPQARRAVVLYASELLAEPAETR